MDYYKVDISIIDSLNESSGKDNYKLSPAETVSGFFVLSVDILTDDSWSWAFDYLNTCEIVNLKLSDFPRINIIE